MYTVWRVFSWGANFRYFRGWLGSHEIFPPTKINAYGDIMRVHDDGRGQKHRGSAANTFQ